MFHGMRNGTKYGTLLRAVEAVIRRRLPPGWGLGVLERSGARVWGIAAPDGRRAELSVTVRNHCQPRDVALLLLDPPLPGLVVANYIGERSRELLVRAGVSYADATGNLRLVASDPAVFLEGVGADKDPDRSPRPLRSLRGAAAARVVRGLAESDLPVGVRELSETTKTPLGTVSRVVSLLDSEALVVRDDRKRVTAVDRGPLLARWSKDFAVTRSNEVRTFLEPRGLDLLWRKLSRLPRYAVTGSTAGPGIASTRLAMIYVDDPDQAADILGLVPAEAGSNVWLLRPFDDVVYTGTRRRKVESTKGSVEVTIVSPAQAFVDLASSPGRGPQEAEAMISMFEDERRAD